MDLARTQLLSLLTKGVTATLTVIQSLIVARLLGPESFGLVGLVLAVGGLVGVTQHVGIVGGAIREIAVQKKRREAAKVFWAANLIRQVVTLPLSLILLSLSGFIAENIYHKPDMAAFLQLFAGILVLQGVQDVLGAALTGRKRFAWLYSVQIATAAINVVVFGYLAWQFGAAGFFAAMVITTLIMVLWLSLLVWREFAGHMALPAPRDLKKIAKQVFATSGFMYLSRILFMVWQRLPLLVLGGVIAVSELGYVSLALRFGGQLTVLSMALSEVNLSWMSSLFSRRRDEFVRVVERNLQRLLVLLIGVTLTALFFAPEVLRYLLPEFVPALPHVLVVTAAFFIYALLDIGTSSVFVPAHQARTRAWIYGIMTAIAGVVIGWLILNQPDALLAVWAVLAGAAASYLVMVWLVKQRFKVALITPQLAVLLLMLMGALVWLLSYPTLLWRIIVFLLLAGYVAWEAYQSKLFPKFSIFLSSPNRRQGYGWQARLRQSGNFQLQIICFAGAALDQPTWTNRQHVMSRVAAKYPVLYVEPRVWVVRFLVQHWRQPGAILSFIKRVVWYEKKGEQLFIKAQWNLIPGSREIKPIAWFNHILNRWWVLTMAWWLGFHKEARSKKQESGLVVWVYDTEAAEYLSAFRKATVVYDCVDDHAAQAGPDRNVKRVETEEKKILQRADLVTVTSRRLLELKRPLAKNVQLVLNAGDVGLYVAASSTLGVYPSTPRVFPAVSDKPVFGSVGALDAYKYDFDLLYAVAKDKPDWNFVFVGAPLVDQSENLNKLAGLKNVYIVGTVSREKAPEYVSAFDVCLIPYRASRYNAASFPLKFWEFMATGKPIVVTGLPELKEYWPLIGYAESADEFARQCEQWLNNPARGSAERKVRARNHSWEKRVDKLLGLLHVTIDKLPDS